MRSILYLTLAAVIAVIGCQKKAPAPKAPVALKATLKQVEQVLPPKTTAVAPKSVVQARVKVPVMPGETSLLVPHQVLTLDPPAKPKPLHSLLVKPKATSTCERHVQETYPSNRVSATRFLPSFGGGRFGF